MQKIIDMKKILFFTSFYFLYNFTIHAQKSNEVRVYYGTDDSSLVRFLGELDGAGSYDLEKSRNFGVKYLRQISKNLFFETGINHFSSTAKTTPSFTGYNNVNPSYEDFKLISVPLNVNYTFLKYFFVNGGTILSFQNTKNSFDKQTGLGLNVGIGAKYYFKNFLVYINPNLKQYATVPFKKENYQQRLTGFELQIGFGYTF